MARGGVVVVREVVGAKREGGRRALPVRASNREVSVLYMDMLCCYVLMGGSGDRLSGTWQFDDTR